MLSNDVLYHAGFKIKYQIKLSEIVALVSMRIDAKCLTSEGYGSQHPVASNDTEEGKAQNRRITVRVTKK